MASATATATAKSQPLRVTGAGSPQRATLREIIENIAALEQERASLGASIERLELAARELRFRVDRAKAREVERAHLTETIVTINGTDSRMMSPSRAERAAGVKAEAEVSLARLPVSTPEERQQIEREAGELAQLNATLVRKRAQLTDAASRLDILKARRNTSIALVVQESAAYAGLRRRLDEIGREFQALDEARAIADRAGIGQRRLIAGPRSALGQAWQAALMALEHDADAALPSE